jgi:hypothetical protein
MEIILSKTFKQPSMNFDLVIVNDFSNDSNCEILKTNLPNNIKYSFDIRRAKIGFNVRSSTICDKVVST